MAEVDASSAALKIDAEQIMARKNEEFQEGLASVQRRYALEQAYYKAQTESQQTLMESQLDLR